SGLEAAWLSRAASSLDELAPGVVEPMQSGLDRAATEELVDGLARSFPVPVVVDLDHPARAHPVVQAVEAGLDALVPVTVEVQHRDRSDLGDRQRALEQAGHERAP